MHHVPDDDVIVEEAETTAMSGATSCSDDAPTALATMECVSGSFDTSASSQQVGIAAPQDNT